MQYNITILFSNITSAYIIGNNGSLDYNNYISYQSSVRIRYVFFYIDKDNAIQMYLDGCIKDNLTHIYLDKKNDTIVF